MLALSKMWALRARWPLGIGGAVAVVVIAAIGWGLLQPSGRGAVAPEPAKPAPGTFRPTPAQLAGLKIDAGGDPRLPFRGNDRGHDRDR